MVINVESSILSAGSTALEVLERSPGVTINRQNNNISLTGKNGVTIMINGKISYLPQASIVQLLEGMSSDNIQSIELITTPPANLDAEGNAGFINIVMKERSDVGLNGSYSLSAGVGNGYTTNNNINFNYRKNKINVYGNYSFLLRSQGQVFSFSRTYLDQNDDLINLSTVSNRDPVQRNHNARIGLDYSVSEKTIIGMIVSGYDNKWTMDAVTPSETSTNGAASSFTEVLSDERNQLSNIGTNFNLKHNFKEDGFFSIDYDYLYYYNENPTNYENNNYDTNGNFVDQELTKSNKTTPINISVIAADYSNQISDKIKIEAGAKGAFSNFENDVVVETFDGQDYIEDPSLTNFSNLDERILAAYTSVDYKISDKLNAKIGLRFEHTDSKLDSDKDGVVVDRSFGELFPSAFFTYIINDSLNMNVSYSRRITRPTFNEMAPFVIFFDPNTFFAGNPAIQPAISNAFKIGTNYKSLVLSMQYTLEKGTIARFQERFDEENERLIFIADNLDELNTFSITLGLPFKITHWWKTQNTLIFLNTRILNTINESQYEQKLNSFNINSTQSFTIADNLTAELNFNYNSPQLFGSLKIESTYFLNVGIQKKLGEKWGTLRFNVNDIFDSFEYNGGTNIPEENLNTDNTFDFSNRTFLLTYTRNFGNKKLKSARSRQTGAEEERKRVN
jgi:outer membrane receptor protein involved in Fe transport